MNKKENLLTQGPPEKLRQRMDESLSSSYALLKAMIDSPKDIIIFSLDPSYCYTAFNEKHRQEMKRVWNVDIEIGTNLLACMHIPQLRESAKQSIDRAMRGEAFLEIQHQPQPDTFYEMSWNPMVQNGKTIGVTLFIKDITELRQAEKKLQENLSVLRIAGEKAKLGGWNVVLGENRVYWSDETAAIHEAPAGHSPLLEDAVEFYAPEWRDKMTRVFSACAQQGIPFDDEMEIITAKGKRVWVQAIGEAVRNEQGKIVKVQGAFQDISERKQNEQNLLQLALDWQSTFDASSDAIFVLNADHRILRANKSAEHIFCCLSADMIGRHCWEIVLGLSEPIENCPVLRVKESLTRESVVFQRDEKWYEINVDPLLDETGKYTGAVYIVSDITRRKWSEEELLRSKERLESLNAILQYQTDSIQQFLDHALDEAIRITGSKIGYIYSYSEEKQEFTLNSWSKEVMDKRKVANPPSLYQLAKTGILGEAVRQRKAMVINDFDQPDPLKMGYPQGQVHLKRFLTVPVFQDSRIVAVVGVANKDQEYNQADALQLTLLMDAVWKMVERQQAALEKVRLEEQFRQAQKVEAIGRLAGGVAHDFNNMLCVILGFGESLMRELPLESRHYQDAREIVEAGRRSAELTRQLLAFSRKQTLMPVVLDINRLLKNLEKMLRRLIGEDIDLRLQLATPLRQVMADPGQIEQVVMNLAVNARDAMPQGGKLTIETGHAELDEAYAHAHCGAKPGSYVMLAISDTGIGMDKEIQGQIFEPFFTSKEQGKGTGLGLSTVYGIVKQSGGNIWVYSEPGQGAVFKVYLPVVERGSEVLPWVDDSPVERGLGEHILVVEDEAALRNLIERTLKELGYRVSLAANGQEALSLLVKENFWPDLLISDVVMPGLNGPQLVERLRQKKANLKVIFMSGYTDNTILSEKILATGAPFLQKPFNTRDLSAKVLEILRGGGG